MFFICSDEVNTDKSITKEDISTFVFFLIGVLGCGEELGCLCQGGQTDHPATIDSMVRLTEELVDTNSVRIKWSINNQKSVVDLSTVKPMHSSHRERQKQKQKIKKLASVEEITTGIRSTPATTTG